MSRQKYQRLFRGFETILFCVFIFPALSFAFEKPVIIAGPYLQHVTKTSIVVMWETDKLCRPAVRFGRGPSSADIKTTGAAGPELLNQKVSSENFNTIHELTLENLEPLTSYLYRVYSVDNDKQQVESEILAFHTAANETSPFVFAVMGDNRTYPGRFKKLCGMVLTKNPDFALNAGDVVTNGDIKEEWASQFFAPAGELMKRVPVYISIGNHERNSSWFYKYVSYPSPENYYSFDYGNAHFTVIDSNADLSRGSKQFLWIEKDLSLSKAKWKFVMHHHPPFGPGNARFGTPRSGNPDLGQLIPLYEKWDIDIVWCGHVHYYERTLPVLDGKINRDNGVIYIQTGGGGADLADMDTSTNWFSAKKMHDWHFCLVNVDGGSLLVTVYDINGRMFDSLELKK